MDTNRGKVKASHRAYATDILVMYDALKIELGVIAKYLFERHGVKLTNSQVYTIILNERKRDKILTWRKQNEQPI